MEDSMKKLFALAIAALALALSSCSNSSDGGNIPTYQNASGYSDSTIYWFDQGMASYSDCKAANDAKTGYGSGITFDQMKGIKEDLQSKSSKVMQTQKVTGTQLYALLASSGMPASVVAKEMATLKSVGNNIVFYGQADVSPMAWFYAAKD